MSVRQAGIESRADLEASLNLPRSAAEHSRVLEMNRKIALFVAGAAAVALDLLVLIARDFRRVVTQPPVAHEEQVDIAAIVTRVRGLNRLETTAMRVTHTGKVSQTYQMIPNAFAGDEVTLMAVGDVIAGVDLSLLKPDDVHLNPDGTVLFRLPPPMILVTRLDNRQTHVVNRKTGIFRRADAQLESHARQYAEQQIRNVAMQQGILKIAKENAQLRIGELAHAMGARRVRFYEGDQLSPEIH